MGLSPSLPCEQGRWHFRKKMTEGDCYSLLFPLFVLSVAFHNPSVSHSLDSSLCTREPLTRYSSALLFICFLSIGRVSFDQHDYRVVFVLQQKDEQCSLLRLYIRDDLENILHVDFSGVIEEKIIVALCFFNLILIDAGSFSRLTAPAPSRREPKST